jgi:hypothetical protein
VALSRSSRVTDLQSTVALRFRRSSRLLRVDAGTGRSCTRRGVSTRGPHPRCVLSVRGRAIGTSPRDRPHRVSRQSTCGKQHPLRAQMRSLPAVRVCTCPRPSRTQPRIRSVLREPSATAWVLRRGTATAVRAGSYIRSPCAVAPA